MIERKKPSSIEKGFILATRIIGDRKVFAGQAMLACGLSALDAGTTYAFLHNPRYRLEESNSQVTNFIHQFGDIGIPLHQIMWLSIFIGGGLVGRTVANFLKVKQHPRTASILNTIPAAFLLSYDMGSIMSGGVNTLINMHIL